MVGYLVWITNWYAFFVEEYLFHPRNFLVTRDPVQGWGLLGVSPSTLAYQLVSLFKPCLSSHTSEIPYICLPCHIYQLVLQQSSCSSSPIKLPLQQCSLTLHEGCILDMPFMDGHITESCSLHFDLWLSVLCFVLFVIFVYYIMKFLRWEMRASPICGYKNTYLKFS